MRVTLRAGAELDVLSPEEARQLLDELERRARDREAVHVRAPAAGVTDATGAASIDVYRVPAGRRWTLHRLVVEPDGYTPGSPYTSPTGYLAVLRGEVLEDWVPLSQGLPARITAGYHDAPVWAQGEVLTVRLVGGPASTTIRIRAQGSLRPA